MDPSLEIRKLSPSVTRELVKILEYAESWKRVMSIIPKVLSKDNYECHISYSNLPKYNSEHFRMIENASVKMRKSCTEILFDEWGTSGRVRATLGHLLHLLVKAELFRAADYIAVALLKQEPPARPKDGPAAPISIIDEVENYDNNEKIEKMLDDIDYPSSAIENIMNSYNTNFDNSNNTKRLVIPEIVISESSDVVVNGAPSFNMPLVVPKAISNDNDNNNESVSDMLKFSSSQPTVSDSDNNSEHLPALNSLLTQNSSDNNEEQQQQGENLPDLSQFLINDNSDSVPNVPCLSVLNATEESEIKVLNATELQIALNSEIIPDMSALISSTNANDNNLPSIPNISGLMKTDNSNVIGTPKSSSSTEQSVDNSLLSIINQPNARSSDSNSRRTCISPLPNLSLNTVLPHFTFYELEVATNNFDMTPHRNRRNSTENASSDSINTESSSSNGRFLGSGAFGSVFLALGLLDQPVAVKKLHLNNSAVFIVNVDDTVTKQFKNEVEVLCKYKHENLLSLIGYSCDGPTYCLLYEYISGGALKERLQQKQDSLLWRERLHIGLGTARAVSYLHTAFSNPLIHRDIKSANILLDCTNKPKLCDFGLIKLTSGQNTNTTTTAIGTSAYMAPEAFRGDVSVKIDTFSFGVVLLELITGLPPLDENRDGHDLVTHMGDCCDDGDVSPFLDITAGSWRVNEINVADRLFKIACDCLEEKKRRPNMVEVTQLLVSLSQEL